MKTKPMMKTLAISAAVLTLAVSVTACSGGGKDEAASASPAAPSASPAASASSSPASSDAASPSASPSESTTATGDFVGLIDNHSIEIKVDGQSQAYQIDPDTLDKVSTWEEGTKVKFQYEESTLDVDGQKVKQYTITAIDKA